MEIQLALKPKNLNINYPVSAEIKLDGVRTIVIKKDDKLELITRNKKTFRFPALERALENMPNDMVLDGEMVWADGKSEYRPKISGIVNSAIHGGDMWDNQCRFIAYDMLELAEFRAQSCSMKQDERWAALHKLYLDYIPKSEAFSAIHSKSVHSQEELKDYYDYVYDKGYEGLIVKDPNAMYMYKRHKSWLKMKNESECTLVCTGVKEGTGKYEGMLGALICRGATRGYRITVSVGTGLTDEDRSSMEGWVGKSIVIKYNSIVMDKRTEERSLFLPVYVRRFG